MVNVTAVVQPKGGGTKSAIVANLAGALSIIGYRVLVVDLDRQGTVSYNLGFYEPLDTPEPKPSTTLAAALLARETIRPFVQTTDFDKISIVPNGHGFETFEKELQGKRPNAHTFVHEALNKLGEEWDVVLLDTRGTLDWSTINAIAAASNILIPIIPDTPNINELPLAFAEVEEVVSDCALPPQNLNLLVTRYVGRTSLHSQMVDHLRKKYPGLPLDTIIRNSIAVSECHTYQKPVGHHAPGSNGAQDYRALAEEFEKKFLKEKRVVNA